MDWITGMQKAIDYIEERLTEELDYGEIAARAFMSSFHFQRVFTAVCGFSVGEYIRSRRLSMAGNVLSSSGAKVIDVALTYGYTSPDSFAKAFTRFHGITPSAAREPGAPLRSFSRLSVKISFEGGHVMDYKIEKKPAFRIAGKSQLFRLNDEFHRDDMPAFWAECHKDGTVEALYTMSRETAYPDTVFGMCYDVSPDCSGDFPYTIGAAYEKGEVPSGCTVRELPAYTWAIFRCVGAMPLAIQDLWTRIYTEFFPASDYQPIHGIDLEVYYAGDMGDAGYVSEIWIPVTKK